MVFRKIGTAFLLLSAAASTQVTGVSSASSSNSLRRPVNRGMPPQLMIVGTQILLVSTLSFRERRSARRAGVCFHFSTIAKKRDT